MAATIWLTLRPSRSSASNIGAEKRKVKRWKKFIASIACRQTGVLSGALWVPAVWSRAASPRQQLNTNARDRIMTAPRAQDEGAERAESIGESAPCRRAYEERARFAATMKPVCAEPVVSRSRAAERHRPAGSEAAAGALA